MHRACDCTFRRRSPAHRVFDLFMEGGHGVKVGKDGQGLSQVWREQLMQFKNVGAELANSIIADYPSPRLLIEVLTL